MNRKIAATIFGAAVPLLLLASAAWGNDGIQVSINNDGTDDILVTVYDTTLGPNAVVLSHARINGFTSVPLSVAADATGRANVSWTAVTADANGRKCGHAAQVGLGDTASVTVRADSTCPASQPAAMATTFEG